MFNFELERIPGNKNRADGLSRIDWDQQKEKAVETTPPVDGFLDQEEDIRLHINEWSLRVSNCVGHPIWLAPKGYEQKAELVLKPFEGEDLWGGKDVQWMMKLALAGMHSLVEEVRTIEEGPDQVEKHEELMGGMYLLVNTLLQGNFDQISSLNPAENEYMVPESQDDELEEGEIKEAFRAEEYDGIYLELGLLLSCEMRDRDGSERAQKIRHLYLQIDVSIKMSPLWKLFEVHCLTENMRILSLGDDAMTRMYDVFLMRIGNGDHIRFVPNEPAMVKLPHEICTDKLIRDLIAWMFEDVCEHVGDADYFYTRLILCATNDNVGCVNDMVLNDFPGEVLRALRTILADVLFGDDRDPCLKSQRGEDYASPSNVGTPIVTASIVVSTSPAAMFTPSPAPCVVPAPVSPASQLHVCIGGLPEVTPSTFDIAVYESLASVGLKKVHAHLSYLDNSHRLDFTKTTMPRGGRGTWPPRRPLGALGGYERHGTRHREHTLVYDDGDIELFLDDFRGHAEHMGWTVTQMIERLRGAGRFEEPIARIRTKARPLGASGGYEQHGTRHREHTPVYDDRDIELFLDDFRGHAEHMGWTVTQMIERLRGAGRFEEPIAQIRREARTWPEVEMRMQELRPSPVGPDGRPICLEIGNVEDFIPAFEQFMHDQRILRDEWARTLPLWTRKVERPLARQRSKRQRDLEPRQELEAHLDVSQWRVSPTSKKRGEPAEGLPREEVREPERETRQDAEEGHAMGEVIEVEDTPPQARAAELGPEIVPEIAHEEGREPRQEESPSPQPKATLSPGVRMEMERKLTDWRSEVISTIDRYLAAHGACAYGATARATPAREGDGRRDSGESRPSHKRESTGTGDNRGETGQSWKARGGELVGKAEIRGGGALPDQPPYAASKPCGIKEMWDKFFGQHGEGLATPERAGLGTSRTADEYLDRKIRFLAKTSFNRCLMLEDDLAGKRMKEASDGVRLEVVEAEEEASLFSPEQRVEEPHEREMVIAMESFIEGRPQRLDTPEYRPEGVGIRRELNTQELETRPEEPMGMPQSYEVAREASEAPSSPGSQKKRRRGRKSGDLSCFFCKDGEHRALQCPKFLKDKAAEKVTERGGRMYDRQGRVVERTADGGRAQLYGQNQKEMSE
ncbi:hypothetical protein CBR_g49801 [Chara braunii]|uniref:Uncharacterized protein n=1 Tax=Chara braunii TaxID=69332 RepID=A0A388JP38_CHABU|nr:hypothetical protein CBR_g49801 [Chara braunii]|eukprot:GBG59541.1 hypothetical protein CBR_g49801 [Chara braunii]